jgi:thimet oligopeptidase
LIPTHTSDLPGADPLRGVTSAAALASTCDEALARGRALLQEIRALAAGPAAALTFDAVLGRLDDIQYTIRLVRGLCQLCGEIHPDAAVRDAARAAGPGADDLETEVFLDAAVGTAVKAVAAGPEAAALVGPRARLLRHALAQLRRNGLDLPPAEQAELRRLGAEISRLGQAFEKNLAEAEGHIEVPPSALEGLPADYAAAHLARALPNGNVVITTDAPDLMPFVRYARDRAAARALYARFDDRAAAANVPLLERLLALRERKARLLGYSTWADYAIEPRMARTPAAVRAFLETVREAVRAAAAEELAEYRAMHQSLGGGADDPLYPPDRYYLEERVRAAHHGYDSQALAEYFELGAVKRGLFEVIGRLYGLAFRRATDAAAWHPEIEAWDALSGGAPIGRVYLDLHPRPNKFKHAGAFEVRPSWRRGGAAPIAALVCNLPRPEAGQPALLTHDQVVTFFHEAGHMLHQLLSESPFATFAGEAVARDFLEVPSQVFEEWAWRREVLDLFARHHQTGAPIPEALFQALTRARRLGAALFTQVQLWLAAMDLEYHSRPAGFDSTEVLREIFAAYQPFAYIEGTHYQATFAHLVGYDAGYYGYQWALSLTHDIFTRFEAAGFLSRDAAAAWRAEVLARGGSDDEAGMLDAFLGRPAGTAAYIQHLSNRNPERVPRLPR